MENRHVITVKTEDYSSVIAAFFMGICFSLLVLFYWILIKNPVIFSIFSISTFIIFISVATLFARPRSINKIVHISEKTDAEKKERDFIGSTQTKVFHKNTCKLAKSIKPEFKVSSDDKSFFKNYKSCKRCMK